MEGSIFKGFETISNHGTSQGILPRFFLQMNDMAQFAFQDKKDLDERFHPFLQKNIHDFTEFYDVFHALRELYLDYRKGLKEGKYYSIDEKGAFNHDRSQELILKKKIKEFFIAGRLLINNFAKSKIIDDDKIVLNDLLIVSKKNFEKNKSVFLEIEDGISYAVLFTIIEDARVEFLTDFNQIRTDFEHNNLQIESFQVSKEEESIKTIEPTLNGRNLIEEIERFYEGILNFIEVLMVFYFGLRAYERTNGFMTLHQRKEFDYSQLHYKYVVQSRMNDDSMKTLIE